MDDLTLLRSFRAECDDGDPRARAAAWEELTVRFDTTSAPSTRRARSPRRGLLALAGVGALAAGVAAILVLSSGSATEPAVAAVLHQTAVVAVSSDAPPVALPGPNQFLYKKMKIVELKGWYPGSYEVPGSPTTRPGGISALVPLDVETWFSPDGSDRIRQTLGAPRFLSGAEQSRWEAAGSPLPSAFNPDYQAEFLQLPNGHEHVLELGRGVIDIEDPRPEAGGGRGAELGYPDLSGVSTDPETLRADIQNRRAVGISEPGEKPLGTQETTESLAGILAYPNATPALRAAAFNALAEMPGVELNRDATDLIGRSGYSISYSRAQHGLRDEYIFDPETSTSLGEREVLENPGQDPVLWKGYQAGLTTRDVAFLESGVVDSTHETAAEENGL